MIHEWQRVTKEIHDGQKKPDNVDHRMSEVLSIFVHSFFLRTLVRLAVLVGYRIRQMLPQSVHSIIIW